MATSPPFYDSRPKGAAKETLPTLAVTAPLGANGDDDRWFCVGRDGRLHDGGRRSDRSPSGRNNGSHAGNVAGVGPQDSVVPLVIPTPGGVIVASIDGGRGGRRPAGNSPVGSVDGDRAAYPAGRSGAIGGGRGGDR